MREKFKSSILFIFLIFISNTLLALTLNKMQVNSKQDEPLNAVIDVIYSKGEKPSNLKPAIASKENYEANGLSRLPIHSNIQIRLEDGASGGKIFLISEEVVKDPFLDLLIQIDSEKGRVYKEYTVLLEPPSTKISIKEGIEKKDEVAKVEPVKEIQQDLSTVKKVKEVKSRIVKSTKGKTLYQIARENKPSGVTTEQMVLAIYQNNPKAFVEKNVNTLIKNRNLKIPPVSYFQNHSHLEARKILRVQNIEWKSKLKKIIKPKIQKKIINKDAIKIEQLEKELVEAKKKLEDISRLNIESKNNSIEELNTPLKENLEDLSEEKSTTEEVDEGVFVSSISDIDENKIEETEIDATDSKGFKTIHVLLLVLFVVLLFGLFILISRRKVSERNQTLSSFVNDNQYPEPSEKNPEEVDQSYKPVNESENVNKSQEQESINSKKNYLPIADDN
jgi:FimV-like protein